MTSLTQDCWLAVVDVCEPFTKLCLSLTCKDLLINYCQHFCTDDEAIVPNDMFHQATDQADDVELPPDPAVPQLYGDERDVASFSTKTFDWLLQQRLAERAESYTDKASSSKAIVKEAHTAGVQAWDGKACGLDFSTISDAYCPSTSTPVHDEPPAINWGEAGRSQSIGDMWAQRIHSREPTNLPNSTLHQVLPMHNYNSNCFVDFRCQDASHRRRLLLIDDYWRTHIKKPLIYKSFITECTHSCVLFSGQEKREYSKPSFDFGGAQDPSAKYQSAYATPAQDLQQWRFETSLAGLEMRITPVLISYF